MSLGRWAADVAITAGRVSEGVERTEFLGRRALLGAADAARSARELHRVGVFGRHRVAEATAPGDVAMFHGDDDKERALLVLDRAFDQFRADVESRASSLDAYGVHPARAQWWVADAMPVLSDWGLFRQHQSSSWTNRLATEWSTYEAWMSRLRMLRSEARAQGLVLASPEPPVLPETMFERGASGRGSRWETAWTIGKVVLYTVVGVAGVASLWAVYRDIRQDRAAEEPHAP